MGNKLCIMCKHFEMEVFSDIGCPTCGGGGAAADIGCLKNHFKERDMKTYELTRSLRQLSQNAELCKDYEPADDDK